MCVRYYEEFGWESREENKEVVGYIGNDQQNERTREVAESQKLRRKEEIQMAEERIGKSHREGQEGVY
jgi:hypothetical protein